MIIRNSYSNRPQNDKRQTEAVLCQLSTFQVCLVNIFQVNCFLPGLSGLIKVEKAE